MGTRYSDERNLRPQRIDFSGQQSLKIITSFSFIICYSDLIWATFFGNNAGEFQTSLESIQNSLADGLLKLTEQCQQKYRLAKYIPDSHAKGFKDDKKV
uniref:Uncharacterized protein n=1 Tax=Zea mays TaxID=4577 RepID=A0A804M170_MAIZE